MTMKGNKYITNLSSKAEGRIHGYLNVQILSLNQLIKDCKLNGYKLENVIITNRETGEVYTLDHLNRILNN